MGGGHTERRAPRSYEGPRASILLLLLSSATPFDTLRNSRQSRGALYPMTLHPHPNQLPPAAQVGGGKLYVGTLDREPEARALAINSSEI